MPRYIEDPDDYCRLCRGKGSLEGAPGEASMTCYQCGGRRTRCVVIHDKPEEISDD